MMPTRTTLAPQCRPMVHVFLACLARTLWNPPAALGIGIWLPFDRIYESSEIVCIADAVEALPAPEPPVRESLEGLRDGALEVRGAANRALDAHTKDPATRAALRALAEDRDSTLAAAERKYVSWE